MANTTDIKNIAILANLTELIAEVAYDVIKKSPTLRGSVDSGNYKRADLQRAFSAKLATKLNIQGAL